MSEERKLYCPDCNAPYSAGAKSCRACGKTLPTLETVKEETELHGMPLSDWRIFIGKNSERYINIFKKYKDKDPFFKFNWAAFFLGYAWFLYRKMFKQTIILFIVSIFLSFVFSAVSVAVQIPMMQKAIDDYKPYVKYITLSGGETEEFMQLDEAKQKEVRSAYWDYKDVVSDASDTATLISSVSSILVNVVVGFMANWLYRDHILNKTVRKKGYVVTSGEGGTSLGAGLFAYFFGETIVKVVAAAISVLFLLIFTGI